MEFRARFGFHFEVKIDQKGAALTKGGEGLQRLRAKLAQGCSQTPKMDQNWRPSEPPGRT